MADIAPGASEAAVRAAPAAGQALVADPARDRLLSLTYDYNNRYDFGAGRALVQAFRPGQPARSWRTAALPSPAGVVVVAAGAIWAGTAGGERPAPPYRLDPVTLRAVSENPGGAPGPTGARLVGAGTSVVWVRPGAAGDRLWCLDARTGQVEQRWDDVPGEVISRSGAAVAIDGSHLTRLILDGCAG